MRLTLRQRNVTEAHRVDPASLRNRGPGHEFSGQRLMGLALAFAVLAVVFLGSRILEFFKGNSAGSALTSAANPPASPVLYSGPWGSLAWVHIAIERPDEYISLNTTFTHQARWFFAGYSPEQLSHLFRTTDMPDSQRARLLDPAKWDVGRQGIYVSPGPELILDLVPQARQRLYPILAENPANYYQYLAFKYRADGFNEWFDRSGLSPEVLALVKRLLYRRGPSLCFSDIVETLAVVPSMEEKLRLIKTLSRVSTLLVKLHVAPDADVDALVRYWGKEGHAKDIKPLLQSLVNVPGGSSIDVAHLLPSFARMRLYTYPFPSEDSMAARRDCFWTAMNFFNETPDDRYCDFRYTRQIIQARYYPVQGELTYGDILWLVDPQGQAIHAAVYVAADIVFTKNGAHFDQPWILMRFQDLLATFPSEQPLHMVAYRLKTTS